MASGETSDIIQFAGHLELLFVEKEDAGVTSYRGWRRELLVEEIVSASEKKLLLCSICEGMLRNACVVNLDLKKEARCCVCITTDLRPDSINNADLIRSVVDDRMVHCPFLSESCKWIGPTLEIMIHLKDCQYVSVPCPLKCFEPNPNNPLDGNVIQKVQRRLLEEHLTQTCPMRLIPCEYCKAEIQVSNSNTHFAICLEYPTQCMNKCIFEGEVFVASRKMIRIHLEFDCPLQKVPCPYSKYGCDVKVVRQDLQLHNMDYMGQHHQLVETNYNVIKSALDKQLDKPSLSIGGIEWKVLFINDRWNKMKEIHSPPFYSCGYKILLCVTFNQNHLEVYISLLKGEYDDELKWPLKCKITFTLVNQSNDFFGDLTESLLSEYDPDHFTKPESEPKYIGFDEFITREEINTLGYCMADSLILRVLLTCL